MTDVASDIVMGLGSDSSIDIINNTYIKKIASSLEEFLENPIDFLPRDEDINLYIEEETVLTHVVKCQMLEAVKSLLAAGVDPKLSNKKGVTPISHAALKGNIHIMQCLLDAGAEVNSFNLSGSTALIQASHFGHVSAVKLLLDNNATADFSNPKGTTALMRASQEGHLVISNLLLQSGADVNRKNLEGMNALMLASQRGHSEMARLLVRSGAIIDEKTAQGSTALMLACKRGHGLCVEVLVSIGAEVCIQDTKDRTALDTAIRKNHRDLLHFLNTQHQIKVISEARGIERDKLLKSFRSAALKDCLRLNNQERSISKLIKEVRKVNNSKYHIFNRLEVESHVDQIRSQLPNSFKDPVFTNAIQSILQLCNNEENMKINLPNILCPIKPGYSEWLWPQLLNRCMYLPEGIFETIMEFLPTPRIWNWTIYRLSNRCKLSPKVAITDISILIDEILSDANIFINNDQTSLLLKICRNPEIHPYLVKEWGMNEQLIESLIQWSDIQSLLSRCSDVDIIYKPALAKRMLIVANTLYKWHLGRCSSLKQLNLPNSFLSLIASEDNEKVFESEYKIEYMAFMERYYDLDDSDSVFEKMLDHDTETEGGVGNQGENDNDNDVLEDLD